MPRDQLPTYNHRGQCISSSYVQSLTPPYSRARVLLPTSITCDDVNYSSYITEHLNKDYVQELPRRYVRHWAIMMHKGAYVSVSPLHLAPDIPLETVDYDVKLLTATNTPIKVYGTRTVQTVQLVSGKVSLYARFYTTVVKKTLLGLHDVLQSGALLIFRDSYTSTVQKGDVEEPALVLPQGHDLNHI